MSEGRTITSNKERSMLHIARDLWLLMKPELTLLSVFTSLGSAFLAIQKPEESQIIVFPLLALGTLFVGGGSGAMNQFFEREEDAVMKRTEKRPVPDERITPGEAFLFSVIISIIGLVILFFVNWLSALLAAATFATYVFLYTPLKRISSLSTIIGAIPGALPTLIGWASIRNSLSIESLTLFAILFYWQMPHFYSIGWLYRQDYRRAGFRLLTNTDITGKKVSARILFNQGVLILVGVSPALVGLVRWEYIPLSLVVGSLFFLFGLHFRKSIDTEATGTSARMLFFSSLFYLPIIFSAMIVLKASL